jgi:hypothetical protein
VPFGRVVPGDWKECGAFERLTATDRTTQPHILEDLTPQSEGSLSRSQKPAACSKGEHVLETGSIPLLRWQGGVASTHSSVMEKAIRVHCTTSKLTTSMCVPSFRFCQQEFLKYFVPFSIWDVGQSQENKYSHAPVSTDSVSMVHRGPKKKLKH